MTLLKIISSILLIITLSFSPLYTGKIKAWFNKYQEQISYNDQANEIVKNGNNLGTLDYLLNHKKLSSKQLDCLLLKATTQNHCQTNKIIKKLLQAGADPLHNLSSRQIYTAIDIVIYKRTSIDLKPFLKAISNLHPDYKFSEEKVHTHLQNHPWVRIQQNRYEKNVIIPVFVYSPRWLYILLPKYAEKIMSYAVKWGKMNRIRELEDLMRNSEAYLTQVNEKPERFNEIREHIDKIKERIHPYYHPSFTALKGREIINKKQLSHAEKTFFSKTLITATLGQTGSPFHTIPELTGHISQFLPLYTTTLSQTTKRKTKKTRFFSK